MTLKNKDKELSKLKLYFRQYFLTEKFKLHGVFWWTKEPDPIRVTQKDLIRIHNPD